MYPISAAYLLVLAMGKQIFPDVKQILISSDSAREDVVLPLSSPIRGVDGKLMYNIPVPKGTDIFVAIKASNTNKAVWGIDALEWKPERWLSPLPRTVAEARIPGVYSNLCVARRVSSLSQESNVWMFATA